jgi:hypothetical protein
LAQSQAPNYAKTMDELIRGCGVKEGQKLQQAETSVWRKDEANNGSSREETAEESQTAQLAM